MKQVVQTSRAMIDEICSIRRGMRNIVWDVTPFCLNWPLTYVKCRVADTDDELRATPSTITSDYAGR